MFCFCFSTSVYRRLESEGVRPTASVSAQRTGARASREEQNVSPPTTGRSQVVEVTVLSRVIKYYLSPRNAGNTGFSSSYFQVTLNDNKKLLVSCCDFVFAICFLVMFGDIFWWNIFNWSVLGKKLMFTNSCIHTKYKILFWLLLLLIVFEFLESCQGSQAKRLKEELGLNISSVSYY